MENFPAGLNPMQKSVQKRFLSVDKNGRISKKLWDSQGNSPEWKLFIFIQKTKQANPRLILSSDWPA